ncbi:MAG TPA: hypothetical protein VIH90_02605 [Candidatus Saccharimonadales bacterium]
MSEDAPQAEIPKPEGTEHQQVIEPHSVMTEGVHIPVSEHTEFPDTSVTDEEKAHEMAIAENARRDEMRADYISESESAGKDPEDPITLRSQKVAEKVMGNSAAERQADIYDGVPVSESSSVEHTQDESSNSHEEIRPVNEIALNGDGLYGSRGLAALYDKFRDYVGKGGETEPQVELTNEGLTSLYDALIYHFKDIEYPRELGHKAILLKSIPETQLNEFITRTDRLGSIIENYGLDEPDGSDELIDIAEKLAGKDNRIMDQLYWEGGIHTAPTVILETLIKAEAQAKRGIFSRFQGKQLVANYLLHYFDDGRKAHQESQDEMGLDLTYDDVTERKGRITSEVKIITPPEVQSRKDKLKKAIEKSLSELPTKSDGE